MEASTIESRAGGTAASQGWLLCPYHSDRTTRNDRVLRGGTCANASPAKLDNNLAALWTAVLETPSAHNSFGSGGSAYACWNLGRTVTPFGPAGVESCTVETGTNLFVVGSSVECSTFEGDPTN
jgi:hypothetical protein